LKLCVRRFVMCERLPPGASHKPSTNGKVYVHLSRTRSGAVRVHGQNYFHCTDATPWEQVLY